MDDNGKRFECTIDDKKIFIDIDKLLDDTAKKIIEKIISYICNQINTIKYLDCNNKDFENNFIIKIVILIMDKLKIINNKDIILEIIDEYPYQQENGESLPQQKGGGDETLPKIIENSNKRQECLDRMTAYIENPEDIKIKIKDKIKSIFESEKNVEYFNRIIDGIIYSIQKLKTKDIEHNCYKYFLNYYYNDLIEDYIKDNDKSIINNIILQSVAYGEEEEDITPTGELTTIQGGTTIEEQNTIIGEVTRGEIFGTIFNEFKKYLKNKKRINDTITNDLLSMKDDDNEKFVNSFKSNSLKKIISENVNKIFKKRNEYNLIQEEEKKKEEKKKEEEEKKKNIKPTILSKTKSYLGNKYDKITQKDTSMKMLFGNFNTLTSTNALQKKVNTTINLKINEISKELLAEIIPNENNESTPNVIKMDEIKGLILESIKNEDDKKENLKSIFLPLIDEYKKEREKNENKKYEEQKNKDTKGKIFRGNLNKIRVKTKEYLNNRIDINNISIINYIIKLCEKTRTNKRILEKNNIYLVKYEPILPKGKCNSKTMMFFDETIKGKIIEQQTLMLYLGDLKFALLCNEYDTTSYKKKVKTFKKYEDFEILSIIKKDASYKMKFLKNEGYGFFNKYYYLEEIQQEGGELVGGADMLTKVQDKLNSVKQGVKKGATDIKEGVKEGTKDIKEGFINSGKTIGNIPKTTLDVGKGVGIGIKDGVKATGRSGYRLGELVPYGMKKSYEKGKDILKNGKDLILKEKEEPERIKSEYNIIGDIIIIKFILTVDEKKEYEYYGTIFKKIKVFDTGETKYEILFRSESIIPDEKIFEFEITYQGKYGDDYLYSIEICIEKDSQYYESNYEELIEIKDSEEKKDKLININIKKLFSFYNYYRDIERTNQILTFKKIVSINKENNEKNEKDTDYIPFVDIEKNKKLIHNLGVIYDTVFFNRELKPEKGYNSFKIDFASKGNKCSGFNKRISCLFLFLNNNHEEVYLKGEHYAVFNEKQKEEEEEIKQKQQQQQEEEKIKQEQEKIKNLRDHSVIEKKIEQKDLEKAKEEEDVKKTEDANKAEILKNHSIAEGKAEIAEEKKTGGKKTKKQKKIKKNRNTKKRIN
jgi:hypothetical protein